MDARVAQGRGKTILRHRIPALARLQLPLAKQLCNQALDYDKRPAVRLLLELARQRTHRVVDADPDVHIDRGENLALGLRFILDARKLRVVPEKARDVSIRQTRHVRDHLVVGVDLAREFGKALGDAGKRIGSPR